MAHLRRKLEGSNPRLTGGSEAAENISADPLRTSSSHRMKPYREAPKSLILVTAPSMPA